MNAEKQDRILLSSGIIMLLVGMKLVMSFAVPGLRSPGELLLSGGLLLLYSIRVFHQRARLD